jgi:hypothetical protein
MAIRLTRWINQLQAARVIHCSLIMAVLVHCSVSVRAQAPVARSVSQLIEDLGQINSEAPGINSGGMYEVFFAEDKPAKFQGGVWGIAPPTVPDVMRKIVEIGPAALPELLKHLDDSRPTKLMVGTDETSGGHESQVGVNSFAFTEFSDEYDPRVQPPFSRGSWKNKPKPMERQFHGRYTVKIGDLCYSIIGQIVNRRLAAVRYQPSAILIVNSPIEAPLLANEVRADWGNADAEFVKQSLLTDIYKAQGARENDNGWHYILVADGALKRLRFYFPESYAALQGPDIETRTAFEKRELQQN